MSTAETDVIRRIHDAINRSLADRFEKDRLIRQLQAENLRLRHELADLRARPRALNVGSVATPSSFASQDLQN
ncbi:MAG: hypothetical protein JWM36_3013 [Hyphomicrobiales bacterium]|nr:hypothetical protein [Hyphomicrobiales bacterium]